MTLELLTTLSAHYFTYFLNSPLLVSLYYMSAISRSFLYLKRVKSESSVKLKLLSKSEIIKQFKWNHSSAFFKYQTCTSASIHVREFSTISIWKKENDSPYLDFKILPECVVNVLQMKVKDLTKIKVFGNVFAL